MVVSFYPRRCYHHYQVLQFYFFYLKPTLFTNFTCMKKIGMIIGMALLVACKKNTTTTITTVPADVLSKGVNLSNWFTDFADPAQYPNRFSLASLQLIKQSGFTYVRLPIGITTLFNEASPSVLSPVNLVFVDAAVSKCLQAGLGVTINLHSYYSATDSLLANDPLYADKIAAYWKAVAGYFKKYPADKLFFEVYNEPHATAAGLTTKPASWWQDVQGKLVAAIREVTTTHSIIVGGEGWNSIGGLLQVVPYNSPNIIYNFHTYDPFIFTHQGATWTGWAPAEKARNVPYPSSPDAVTPAVAAATDPELKNVLQWYGSQHYGLDSIDRFIKVAADWATAHKVKIIANEFGSYKLFAPKQSRLNWIHDVRITMEKYKIGWAMWECDEGFGWIDYPANNRAVPVPNKEVLMALGLQ